MTKFILQQEIEYIIVILNLNNDHRMPLKIINMYPDARDVSMDPLFKHNRLISNASKEYVLIILAKQMQRVSQNRSLKNICTPSLYLSCLYHLPVVNMPNDILR